MSLGPLWASLIAQLVKNLHEMQETPVPFLGWEDLLEKEWATHSSILGLLLWFSWHRGLRKQPSLIIGAPFSPLMLPKAGSVFLSWADPVQEYWEREWVQVEWHLRPHSPSPVFYPNLCWPRRTSAIGTRGSLSKSSVLWILFVVNILWVDPNPGQQP